MTGTVERISSLSDASQGEASPELSPTQALAFAPRQGIAGALPCKGGFTGGLPPKVFHWSLYQPWRTSTPTTRGSIPSLSQQKNPLCTDDLYA
uniref:Uncharacterized protein n=1 Tax=Leersia perrieri TaxID=77586 RepID=A0A0D9WYB4_9ORYZ